MDEASAGRQETVRYHQDFYVTHELFAEGSWLHRPSPFVLRSLDRLEARAGVVAVDLGAGVGRHTIPMAQRLPSGSLVVGVDLLPVAAERLRANAEAAGVGAVVQAVVGDLDHVALAPGSVDLIVSVSALEHAANAGALEKVLRQCQLATRTSGLHCFIIGTDKVEVTADGSEHPARVEFPLGRQQAQRLLQRVYESWTWLHFSTASFSVDEERDGEHYALRTTNVRLLARRR